MADRRWLLTLIRVDSSIYFSTGNVTGSKDYSNLPLKIYKSFPEFISLSPTLSQLFKYNEGMGKYRVIKRFLITSHNPRLNMVKGVLRFIKAADIRLLLVWNMLKSSLVIFPRISRQFVVKFTHYIFKHFEYLYKSPFFPL